ncbi:MAG: TetR/AcrR family transcriptional regulator [Dysgonamonadaceae bacterium]|jgi:AcrR family transcriptional regulator|nr:TetR/AcrR family transcriptional regulator [Dysgonamonadaceae bacterium]
MELRDRIIEEASLLFFNNGIKSMTMSDIANELGISKRTLYEVFHDKEELLEKCIVTHMKKADQEMEALIKNSEDVIDTLMQIYKKHLNDMRNVHKTVIHDLKKYHTQIYKKIECKQKEVTYIFIPLLKKGVEQGLIRNDVNFEILIWLLKSQFKALMADDFIPVDKYSVDEFIRTIILNFIRGIATPLGNEKIDMIVENLKKR